MSEKILFFGVIAIGCWLLPLNQLYGQLIGDYSISQNNFQRINPAAINHFGLDYAAGQVSDHMSAQYRFQGVNGLRVSSVFDGRYERLSFRNNVHWGIGFQSEQIHFNFRNRLQGSYAYMLNLSADKNRENSNFLIFGGSGEVGLYGVKVDEVRLADERIPDLPVSSALSWAFQPGVFYMLRNQYRSVYAGLSIRFSDGGLNHRSSRHYHAMAGGVFHLKPQVFSLEGAAWARYADAGNIIGPVFRLLPMTVDGTLRIWAMGLSLNKRKRGAFFAGLGGGNHGRVKIEAGLGLFREYRRYNLGKAMRLGLAYDFDTRSELGFGNFLEFFITMPMPFSAGNGRRPTIGGSSFYQPPYERM